MIRFSICNNGRFCWEEAVKAAAAQEELLRTVREGESQYADSLGWMNPDDWASPAAVASLAQKAEEVRRDADIFVLVGVGGSNQAARAVIKALQHSGDGPRVLYSGNTLSPYEMSRLLEELEGKSVYVNVIAKNFETLEPGISFRMLRAYLERTYGKGAARRIFVTGTPGSSFEILAEEQGYTFLTFPRPIGGRYSVFSDVGLFPMAVAGIDIAALMEGAQAMRKFLYKAPAAENPALQYACARNRLLGQGYDVEMLAFFEPRLRYLAKWWVQLFAESEGKEGKGLLPSFSEYSEDLHSVGQFVQDGSPILFETFLTVEDPGAELPVEPSTVEDGFGYLDGSSFAAMNRAAEAATIKAHGEKFPCLCLAVPRLDAHHFGELFYLFLFSCYLSGKLLGVNPFNQPGVEAYKQLMFRQLGK